MSDTKTPRPLRTYERQMLFRGLNAKIEKDEQGEFLEIIVPCTELPQDLYKLLKGCELTTAQSEEIVEAISQMTAMNYMMGHVRRDR